MQLTRLWNIYEEHFDEAAFLWTQWERALASSNHTIDEVAAGPEARLLAHLDGLVLGGLPVQERLLLPALTGGDASQLWVAGWALLEAESGDQLERLWGALVEATAADRRRALGRALELSSRADIPARLAPQLGRHGPEVDAVIIDVIAARDPHRLARLPLSDLGKSSSGELLAAVLRAAQRVPAFADRALIERGLLSDDLAARGAAVELGALLSVPSTRAVCRQAIAERAPLLRLAMLVLGLAADAPDYQRLIDWSASTDLALDALWALGFTGRVDCAEHLLAQVDDPVRGPVAAESFGSITGSCIDGSYAVAGTPAPLAPMAESSPIPELRADDDLPVPDGGSLRVWWRGNAQRFDRGVRHVYGRPWSVGSVASALTRAATWRRQGLRLALGEAALAVDLRTWARTQARARFPAGILVR